MTDNKIFDYIRDYLAAFVLNSFRQYEGRTRMSCEVWLKNEGLPVRESLYELYIWFMRERGIDGKLALQDLNLLGERMNSVREESFYKERKGRNQ